MLHNVDEWYRMVMNLRNRETANEDARRMDPTNERFPTHVSLSLLEFTSREGVEHSRGGRRPIEVRHR